MKWRLFSLLLVLALLLGACAGNDDRPARDDDDDDERIEDTTGETTEPMVVQEILFQREYDADAMKEYAVITGLDADGAAVWQTESKHYDVGQLDSVTAIGMWEDRYYYVEGGVVTALARETGESLWENPGFGGSPASERASLICSDGTIYTTGYFGPDFMAIDKDGNTLTHIGCIDNDYYWPYEIQLQDGMIVLTLEGGPEGDGTFYFTIDPQTWEVTE